MVLTLSEASETRALWDKTIKQNEDFSMKPKRMINLFILVTVTMILGVMAGSEAIAADGFKYNCSNQVYSAFSKDQIKAFTETSGVKVDVRTASSGSSMYALGQSG